MLKSIKLAILGCFFIIPLYAQTTIDSFDFESGLDSWTQSTADDFDLTRQSGGTPSAGTGPNIASSGNFYMFAEMSSPRESGDSAIFTSPVIDLAGYMQPAFSFDYHMYSSSSISDVGTLTLEINENNTGWQSTSFSLTGSQNVDQNTWLPGLVDLLAYQGSSVQFRFVSTRADDYRGDIAFDNIAVEGTALVAGVEIYVAGNGFEIPTGTTAISITNGTDFGGVNLASSSVAQTFTIENWGLDDLILNNSPYVSITGADAAHFSIDVASTTSPITSANSTTFQVTFSPLSLGAKTATIQISNNDTDEGLYSFNVQGTGVQNFFDSDGDGVFDHVDIDDDNDGVLDAFEENACKNSSISVPANYKFLNETFGTLAPGARTTINTSYNATTTYCYEEGTGTGSSCGSTWILDDGEYVVVSKITGTDTADPNNIHGDLAWTNVLDHTAEDGDTGGMAVFNAAWDPGVFYETTITGILPNVPITYSFWVLNIMAQSTYTGSILPNVTVQFVDLFGNIITSIDTGEFGRCAAGTGDNTCTENEWQNFTRDDIVLGNVDKFIVRFINNAPGGAGNDLALDDIVISQTLCDTDSDGVADVFDLDSDNDGIPDVVESGLGIISLGTAKIPFPSGWVDANGNGMHDAAESNVILDSDSDGTPNYLDLDSDNDGIFDVDESGAGNTANATFQNGDGDISGNGVGQGPDTDYVRETDYESDGALEYFTDGILDVYDYFNGSTFETAYGNENQGIGNTYYVLDSDADGIPDYMDVTSDGVTFDISHTLYANLDADNDGIIDDTNDSEGDGIVDLFDTDDSAFGSPRDLDRCLNLYFDGRNDYAEDSAVINAWGEATMMCWIKMDPASAGIQHILGQNEFYIQLNADKTISAHASGNTLNYSTPLNVNQWVHIATSYSSLNNEFKLFINGEEIAIDTGVSGALSADTSLFTIGKLPGVNSNFYHGYIDEVRVFNKALSNNELQKIVYQEIENNGGIVRGSIIPMNVTNFIDEDTVTPLDWTYLQRYFKMDVYKDDIIDDLSTPAVDVGAGATIYNMKIIDVQTAPLPFVTNQTGTLPTAVNHSTNGVNGADVITYDWSIVKILHDAVYYNNYQKHLGLIVNNLDASSNPIEYSIQNNSELNVSWYLKLDGFIDLEGESQLVQGAESVLDEDSVGYIEQDQQGTQSSYNYNYWSSSVAPIAAGAGTNNASNTISEVLFDGTTASNPAAINFQPEHTAADAALTSPITLSSYWLYTFNGLDNDYNSWVSIDEDSSVLAGEGYTMKGTSGVAAIIDSQNYVFKGKPHNGNITLNIALNYDRLIGNPYPSALDANAFILDNINDSGGNAATNVFNGALYFWDHFSGHTHVLREYVGGYATYTLMGGAKAYANDERINNNGSSGVKIPERYIPVNQGFFVVAILDTVSNSINTSVTGGTITFKNSQRKCVTENSGNSVFLKAATSKETTKQFVAEEDTRSKIRLLFKSPTGYERQLLVGADENASSEFDLGYDGLLIEDYAADMFWTFNGAKFVIQAVNAFNIDQELKIGLKVESEGVVSISIDTLENIDERFDLFIHDNLTGKNYDLTKNSAEIYLEAGDYMDRFDVRFKAEKTLSVEHEATINQIDVFVNNSAKELQIKNTLTTKIKTICLYNSLGQLQHKWQKNLENTQISLPVLNKITGVYFVQIDTDKGVVTKKIIIN